MDETLSGMSDTLQLLGEQYPEPEDGASHPYPIQATPSNQYRLFTNTLNEINADLDAQLDGETHGPEGMPMANGFLNLRPDDAQDAYETAVGESEAEQSEAATDHGSSSRGRGGAKGRGKGRRGWKWALKGTSHDPKLNREKKPRGRPPGSGAPIRRRKKVLDPGYDFKEKQVKATKALLDGRFEDALESAREAVQANPEIYAAHSLLSEALQALGREQDSLAALLTGAIVARDPNTWMLVGDRTLEYAGEDRTTEVLQQALFCYSQAIDLEKHPERNIPARLSKLEMWTELGEYPKARRDCKVLVAILPGDIELTKQLADLSIMTGDIYEISLAKKAYEVALDATFPADQDVADDRLDLAWSHLNMLAELVDRISPPPETVLFVKAWARRFLGRASERYWDDFYDDDREFDIDDTRRQSVDQFQTSTFRHDHWRYGDGLPLELRVKLGLYRLKTATTFRQEAAQHLQHLLLLKDEIDTYYDLFHAVAVALQNKGEYELAIEFYEPILQVEDVVTDDFHLEYGRCLVAAERYQEAATSFKRAIEVNASHLDARVELARLYQGELHDNDQAFALVDQIIALNREGILQREKLNMRPGRKRRTRDYDSSSDEYDPEVNGDEPVGMRKRRRRSTRNEMSDLDDSSRSDDASPPTREAVAERARRKMARLEKRQRARLEKQKARAGRSAAKIRSRQNMESMSDLVATYHDTVQKVWSGFEAGEPDAIEEWFGAAKAMYDIFRAVKQFYPTRDKHLKFRGFERLEHGEAKFMAEMESWRKELEPTVRRDGVDKDFAELYHTPQAPEDNLPIDFCGIAFDIWHHIFVDLALHYARQSQQRSCYQVVDEGLYGANVFYHDSALLNTTQATSLSCAFIFNDSERLCFASRWFINKSDFLHASGFQLLSAANRLSYGSSMWYSAGPTQKHMLRVVKALDYHHFPPEVRKKFDWGMQGPGMKNRLQRIGNQAGQLDANAILTYGHMVGVANHSQSSLPYFFRAYALQPQNITVNLSIAVQYLQNALKRQTDNRQYNIIQGMTFLQRYQEARSATGKSSDRQEAAFNTGRMWHALGLTHLAVGSYEEALDLRSAVLQEYEEAHPDSEQAAEDFSTEAAFALSTMFAIAGNDSAAKQLVERYLVL